MKADRTRTVPVHLGIPTTIAMVGAVALMGARPGNAEQTNAADTYIITFKAAPPLNPRTPRDLLQLFNERHSTGATTHHFRTEVSSGTLIGRICVDGKAQSEALSSMLKNSKTLVFIDCVKPTPQAFNEHVASKQVSLPPAGGSGQGAPKKGSSSGPRGREQGPPLSFTLRDIDGREVRSSDYQGAPVLIMAGACWCGGCQQDAEPLRLIAEEFGPKGLQVIRSVSFDNELAALEFQKHYRLRFVQLLDPAREFEKKYNRDGWTFLMLADKDGRVIYRLNNPGEEDWSYVRTILKEILAQGTTAQTVSIEGVPYIQPTLERSGETKGPHPRDSYPCLAGDSKGRLCLAFTSNRNGTQDVFLRVHDGETWSQDKAVVSTSADEFDPSLTVDGEDRVWLSWTGNGKGNRYNIFVSCLSDAQVSAEPTQITDSEDDAMHCRLSADSEGRIWATYYKWHKLNGRSRDKEVYVRHTDSKGWSKEVQVSPTDVPDYEDHTEPAIVATGNSVLVCWSWDFHSPNGYSRVPEDPSIFLRKIQAGPSLGPIKAVSADCIDSHPSIAVGKDGQVWCAWESAEWNSMVRAYRKTVCRAGMDPEQKEKPGRGIIVNGICRNVCTPTLASNAAGDIALVWAQTNPPSQWALNCSIRKASKSTWTKPMALCTEGNPRFPTVVWTPKGRLWVAYAVERDNRRQIDVKAVESESP